MAGQVPRRGAPRSRVVLVVVVLVLVAAALILVDRRAMDSGAGSPPSAGPGPVQTGPGDCPDERAAPDPDRPVVDLSFSLADDGRTVTGTERVTFTPDVATGELVFRLVPNGPEPSGMGNLLNVDRVTGPDVTSGRYEAAGAGDPGGLYVVPLSRRLPAGESTSVRLDFTLHLGTGRFDRVGAADGLAWWASGAPLLAWEPGVGWARDPFVGLPGETATSPAADTTLSVDVPADRTVLMTGDQADPSPARDGRRTWTSTEPAARDVSVAVGDFTTATTTVDGVRVTTGVLGADGDVRAEELGAQTAAAISALGERFGPFPYATLTVPQLPDYGGGIEYPSSILLASPSDVVLVHEVAHMWFYGMVGNSQFRDPWLDESFASYAESVVERVDPGRVAAVLARPGRVGGSMTDYQDDRSYVTAVYGKGAAMLLTARDSAGAEAFDAALRCYVDARAWAIATPADVATALEELPAALDVLVTAGALDPDDLSD